VSTPEVGAWPEAFGLQPDGDNRFLASSIGDPDRHDVVFGGQILAQMILASSVAGPGANKPLASLHTVFARAASLRHPLEIGVETIHDGRTVGSATITVVQGDRQCARGLAMLQSEDPDVIAHQPEMPVVGSPEDGRSGEDSPASGLVAPGTELRVVGGVDTWDPDAPTGPAELAVWIKLPTPPEVVPGIGEALLAYATDGFLIGTAMRPHAGIGQAMAHRSLDTGVLTHTLTFHRPIPVAEWLLVAHEGAYAGRGRAYGRAHVFDRDGTLVASFVQESLIRQGRS
jgi:acyl-CoA thioesterase II